MDYVAESLDSPEGDDDKVYLFFSENAMEYDFYSKVAVSRVARVCKVKFKNSFSLRPLGKKCHVLCKSKLNRLTVLYYCTCGSWNICKKLHMTDCSASMFRGIWAARGHCRGNGHRSWKLVWTVPFLNSACPPLSRTSSCWSMMTGGRTSSMPSSFPSRM